MKPRLSDIQAMLPAAQAEFWAAIEDELLLDLDLGVGHGVTETDPIRIEAAWRLEDAGVVVVRPGLSPTSVHVERVFPRVSGAVE